jgi:hypothetical protein
MSISVYPQTQDVSPAPAPVAEHHITRSLSTLIMKAGLARRIGQDAIRLTTTLPWPEIKKLARAHVDPMLQFYTFLPVRDYPEQRTCMGEAFQRCMRYPLQLTRDQRSQRYSFHLST